jgi:hypothetical protein
MMLFPVARTVCTRLSIIICLLFSTFGHDCKACNVPVFRYALERWHPDAYQVFIFFDNPIEQNALELLQKQATGEDSLSNFTFHLIDLRTEAGQKAAAKHEVGQLPWLQVFYPANAQVRGLVWQARFNPDNVRLLLHSSARDKLANELLAGTAAVWILLQSGQPDKDKGASQTLQRNLVRASQELKIPSTGIDIDGNPIEVSDFRAYDVKFNMIEISRHSTEEVLLVSTLLGSEPDLEFLDAPMAFPVFGRGRSLYAIVGAGINDKVIMEACQSIINWCSCEIKALNPGLDLLMSVDWSDPAGGQMVKEVLPPLTGISGFMTENSARPVSGLTQADSAVDKSIIGTKYSDSEIIRVATVPQDSLSSTTIYAASPQDNLPTKTTYAPSYQDSLPRTNINAANLQDSLSKTTINATNPVLFNVLLLSGFGIAVVLLGTLIVNKLKDKSR